MSARDRGGFGVDDDDDADPPDDDDGPRTGGGSPSFPGGGGSGGGGSDDDDDDDGPRTGGGSPSIPGGSDPGPAPDPDPPDDDPDPSPGPSTGGGSPSFPGGSDPEPPEPDPDPSPGPSTGRGEPSLPGGTNPEPPEPDTGFNDELGGDPADAGRSGPADANFSDRQVEAANQLDERFDSADIGPEDVVIEDDSARLTDEAADDVTTGRRDAADGLIGDPVGETPEETADSEPDRGPLDRVVEERLNPAAEAFNDRVADPIAGASAAVSPVARGADAVTGGDRFTDSREDFVRSGVNVLNAPAIAAGGIRIGQRVADDTARTAGGEGDEVAADLGEDIEQAAVQFEAAAREEPLAVTSSIAGGAVAGFGAGAAATRGARAASSAARGSRVGSALDDIGSTGAASRTPNIELRRDPNSGPIDIDPVVGQRIREGVTDRLPDNSPTGTTTSDVFGRAGGPGPRVSTGRSVGDELGDRVDDVTENLDDVEAPGTTSSDVFGTAGRPGPRVSTGRSVADELGDRLDTITEQFDDIEATGTASSDVFGTAGAPGPRATTGRTIRDFVPSNRPAGDTPADIFGTAPRSSRFGDLLPSNAPAGDTPSDIFGTAPRAGTVTDRLPSNAPAGDTPGDIFRTARAAEDTPPLSRDTTLRVGPSRPQRTTATSADGDSADFELVVDEDDADRFDLEFGPDDADDAAGAAGDFDLDVESGSGSGAGSNQLSRVRTRDSDGTDTDTRTRPDRAATDRTPPTGAAAGIAVSEINDVSGVTPGNTDQTAPGVDAGQGAGVAPGLGLDEPITLDEPVDVDSTTRTPQQPTTTGDATTTGTTSTTETITDTTPTTDTTTTPTTRTPAVTTPTTAPPRPDRPRPPRLRDIDVASDDDTAVGALDGDSETFENPTQSLGEVDDALTEGLDGP